MPTDQPLPVHDGFDADTLLCPGHEWIIEDRTPPYLQGKRNDWYLCDVCAHCRAIRCDAGHGPLRCLEARHHVMLPHRLTDGRTWPIGGETP